MSSTGFPHALCRLVVVVGMFVACSMGFWPHTVAPVHAAALLANVGARTPFNQANSLDLANYCNGSDQVDDTECIGNWITAAKSQGKHLYVSSGTYLYSRGRALFNGVHLKCASPTQAIFKNINNVSSFFVIATDWGVTGEPYEDISFENCGFDLNGAQANWVAVIVVKASAAPARNITVRGNKIYDSAQPGQMYTARNRQRQYIVALNVEDVLVDSNTLSEGGRIKVGQPGQRIVIRNNTLHDINDNGITVVDKGSSTSADILIAGNTITNSIGSGIFFGADGQTVGTPEMATYDVTVRNNNITGDMPTGCITGVMPNHAARIYVANNTCQKTGSAGQFTGGIVINRAGNPTLPAQDITVEKNVVRSAISNEFDLGGIFFSSNFTNVCVIGNEISGVQTAIEFHSDMTGVVLTGNTLNSGTVVIGPRVAVDQSGNTSACFDPNP